MRVSPGHWLRLWESGEIWQKAARAKNGNDLARLLGTTPDSLEKALTRLRVQGFDIPELRVLIPLAKRSGWNKTPILAGKCGEFVCADQEFKTPNSGQTPSDIEEPIPSSESRYEREYGADYERIHGTERQPADEWDDKTDPGIPFPDPVPEGFHVKGLSTLYDADGNPRAQWVKANKTEQERMAALLEAVTKIAEPFRGAHEPVSLPTGLDDDLLAVYPFGDPHFGLYSWAAETGEDFDLDIAERITVGAIDHLVRVAPAAKQCLILSVGDTLHADSYDNRTQSGHPLDVDTRWSKVLQVTVRAYRRCIDRALEKHEHVTKWIVPGNHDPHSALVLGICLAQYYERDPRVTIDTSPGRFRWMRFGQNLIGATHGDKAKPRDMALVMACDRPEDWGATRHRRIYSGHLHHDRTEEFPGVTVDVLRTLAAKDAWHAAMGYRSGRDMKCDVYHRDHGLISRHAVNVTQLLEQAA